MHAKSISNKILPSVHRVNKISIVKHSCSKCGLRNKLKHLCKDSMFEKTNDNTITCEDGTMMCKCKCNKCRSFINNYSKCSTTCNFHKDRTLANRHGRKEHRKMLK